MTLRVLSSKAPASSEKKSIAQSPRLAARGT
jgi:hypothetical protein